MISNFSDELYHYGVKGMRWGIRKDPKKALTKAYAKRERLNARADKAQAKADKLASAGNSKSIKAEKRLARAARLQKKADRYAYKGMKSWSAKRGARYQLKASKYQMKASRIRNRGARAAYRVYKNAALAKKAANKAKKWASQMDNVIIEEASKRNTTGKEFVEAFLGYDPIAKKKPD